MQRSVQAPGRFAWLRGEMRFAPLLILIGVAVALRAATVALWFPGVMRTDSLRYALVDDDVRRLFDDFWMPAVYPAFLAAIRLVSDQVWTAIAVQHLLGVLAGTSLYLALRRLELPRWVALIPAAVYLLDGDVLFLEHAILTDQLALALTTLALCAAIFGLRPKPSVRWLAAAGALASAAWLTRSPFALVLLALIVVAAAATSGRRQRALAAGAVAAGAVVIFGAYLVSFELSGGRYLGLSDMKGWNLYSRVAPFAACSQFDVPEQSRVLCEESPPPGRAGPFFYVWDPYSISLRSFEQDPDTDGRMWAFATSAIRGQPRSYASAVLGDLARYIRNSLPRPRQWDGNDAGVWAFDHRSDYAEAVVLPDMERNYDGTELSTPGQNVLAAYQDVFRLHGILIAALLALALAGAIWGRGPGRLGIALFGPTAILLYLGPTATAGFDFRYGVPPSILLACAGTLGAYALWLRRGERSPTTTGSAQAR